MGNIVQPGQQPIQVIIRQDQGISTRNQDIPDFRGCSHIIQCFLHIFLRVNLILQGNVLLAQAVTAKYAAHISGIDDETIGIKPRHQGSRRIVHNGVRVFDLFPVKVFENRGHSLLANRTTAVLRVHQAGKMGRDRPAVLGGGFIDIRHLPVSQRDNPGQGGCITDGMGYLPLPIIPVIFCPSQDLQNPLLVFLYLLPAVKPGGNLITDLQVIGNHIRIFLRPFPGNFTIFFRHIHGVSGIVYN